MAPTVDVSVSGLCRYPGCRKRFNRSYEVIRHLAKIHGKREYTVLEPEPYLDLHAKTLLDSSDQRLLEVGATTPKCIPRLRRLLKEVHDKYGHLRRAYATRQRSGLQEERVGDGGVSHEAWWSGGDECSQPSLSSSASASSGEDTTCSSGSCYQLGDFIPTQDSAWASLDRYLVKGLPNALPLGYQSPGSGPTNPTSNYIDIGPDIHAFRTQNVTNELDLLQRDTDWYCTQYATAAYRLGDEAVDTLPWENHGPSISITNPFEPAASFAFPSPYSHVAWTPFEGDPTFTHPTPFTSVFSGGYSHPNYYVTADSNYAVTAEPNGQPFRLELRRDWDFSM